MTNEPTLNTSLSYALSITLRIIAAKLRKLFVSINQSIIYLFAC